jgi:RNA polymerase sigma-70 factor (ECF subfamily)
LPSGLGAPADDHRAPLAEGESSVPWLQPVPDALVADPDDPAAVVAGRAGVRLAFVAALQHLPPRQRAVLTLRDVLAFRTVEVADLLDTSVDAVDAALRRARARLARAAPVAEDLVEPAEGELRTLIDDYVRAFTDADPDALVALLRADARMEMPPIPTWFAGREAVVGFLAARVLGRGRWRLRPTRANGQPAFTVHRVTAGGTEPYGVQVLTLAGGRIAGITAFNDPTLVSMFEAAHRPLS